MMELVEFTEVESGAVFALTETDHPLPYGDPRNVMNVAGIDFEGMSMLPDEDVIAESFLDLRTKIKTQTGGLIIPNVVEIPYLVGALIEIDRRRDVRSVAFAQSSVADPLNSRPNERRGIYNLFQSVEANRIGYEIDDRTSREQKIKKIFSSPKNDPVLATVRFTPLPQYARVVSLDQDRRRTSAA